jgi:protein-tyrosine phosphatase
VRRLWIEFDGLANLRDVGGLPTTDGGSVRRGRLLRSDNLQDLSARDIERLLAAGVSDVIDLRSPYEVDAEGPGPLSGHPRLRFHQHSFFRDWAPGVGEDKPDVRPETVPDEALPWADLVPSFELDDPIASIYLAYLVDRPDSVLAGLRAIAYAEGAALVHCAAGKDRTGTLVAIALSLVGVEPQEIVSDYAASTERAEGIVARLSASPTYAESVRDRPIESHYSRPEAMQVLLRHIDEQYGGMGGLAKRLGWTDADQQRLRSHLLDG